MGKRKKTKWQEKEWEVSDAMVAAKPLTTTSQAQGEGDGPPIQNIKFYNLDPSVIVAGGGLDEAISYVGETPGILESRIEGLSIVPATDLVYIDNQDKPSVEKPEAHLSKQTPSNTSIICGRKMHVPVISASLACEPSPGLEDSGVTPQIALEKQNPPTNSKINIRTAATDCVLPAKPCLAILRGRDISSPYIDINSFPILWLVEKGLKNLRITDINSLQRCAWPHIFRGRNCLIVGGASDKQGKTLAYLVPLCANLMNNTTLKSEGRGPVAIILCGSANSAKKIEVQLNILAGNSMTVYRGARSDPNLVAKVKANPDVLICQPHLIPFLSKYFSEIFGYKRLQHFIMDDTHILEKEFSDELRITLDEIEHEIQQTVVRQWPVQFILCGKEWNSLMSGSFVEDTPFLDPVLVIGSFTQSLKYGGVRLLVKFVHEAGRIEAVISTVDACAEKFRDVVVVCRSRDAARKLALYSEVVNGITVGCVRTAKGTTVMDELRLMRTIWKNRTMSAPIALFVCDDDLSELGLTDVTTLIHFDMPARKLDAFGERHMCMWQYFPNYPLKESGIDLRSYVFLSPEEPEVDKILTQLELLQANIPPQVSGALRKIRERILSTASVCQGFKLYGRCTAEDKEACARIYLHSFSRKSILAECAIPRTKRGNVKMQIKGCFDVNQYLARLLEFQEIQNGVHVRTTNYEDETKNRHKLLHKIYSDETKRKVVADPQIGDVYCIRMMYQGSALYTRAVFDQTVHYYDEENGESKKYRVFCIDVGIYQQLDPSDVFVLADDGVAWCPLVVNVIMANIQPPDGGTEFPQTMRGLSGKAKDIVKDKVVVAPVHFAVENTIWVKNMYEYETKGSQKKSSIKLDARREFINTYQVAVENPSHLSTLYAHIEGQGSNCELLKTTGTFSTEFHAFQGSYRTAFLDLSGLDKPKTIKVLPTYVVSPDRIYVIKESHCDLMYKLQDELHAEIELLIKCKYHDYKDRFLGFYQVTMCVAAIDPTGKWARAIITRVLISNVAKVDVYFVDVGDVGVGLMTDKIFPIPTKYVTRMPFQSTYLRLSHIQPVSTEREENPAAGNSFRWPKSAKQFLCDYLLSDTKPLRTEVVVTHERARDLSLAPLGFNGYDAFLIAFDTSLDELGEELVKRKLAEFAQGGRKKLAKFKSGMLKKYEADIDKKTRYLNLSQDDSGKATELEDSEDTYEVNFGSKPEFLQQLLDDMGVPTRVVDEVPSQPKAHTSRQTKDHGAACAGAKKESPKASGSGQLAKPTNKHSGVIWSQTKRDITLRVYVTDLKTYNLRLEEDGRTITLETIEPAGYAFCFPLFRKLSKIMSEILTGQYLIIKLEKLTPSRWERILWQDVQPPKWLKPDMDNLKTESDCEHTSDEDHREEKKPVTQQKPSLPPPPEEFDDTDSSSIDDEEMERLFG